MKLTMLAILVAVAALGAALLLLTHGDGGSQLEVTDQRVILGIQTTITVIDRNRQEAEDAVQAAFERFLEIESVSSLRKETSELNQLNGTSYLADASDELVEMIRLSQIVNQVSDGAFDVSHGALLDLWDVETSKADRFQDLEPAAQYEAITEAQAHVGMNRILLGTGRKTSISLVPGTRVDLGGIEVGYAVDAAIETLQETGIEHAMVQAGDHLRVFGGTPSGTGWRVALENSDKPNGTIVQFFLNDGAISTAGNYERFFDSEAQMERIIDPRTGYPATAVSSATVLAPTCAEANALATAVFVLGLEPGLALIEGLGKTEALILEYDNPTETQGTSGIDAFGHPPRN